MALGFNFWNLWIVVTLLIKPMICWRFEGYVRLSLLMCLIHVLNLFHIYFWSIMWLNLFGILCLIALVRVGCRRTLDQFLLTSFVGFGERRETKSLWSCSVYATLFGVYGWSVILVFFFFFWYKRRILLTRREKYYKENGGQEILITKNRI